METIPAPATCEANRVVAFIAVFSGFLFAQNDDALIDTLPVDQDNVVTQAPAEEEKAAPDEEEKTSYFLQKKEYQEAVFTPSVQSRKIPAPEAKQLKADQAFWYADYVFKEKKEKKTGSFFNGRFFQTILWIIIIASFAAVIILYLANSHIGLFRKSRNIRQEQDEEGETDDIFAINYKKEIDRAVNAHNYRLAVRLHFLQSLRTMAEKNIIQYKQDRTNFDYLLQLRNSAWYTDFFRLTRHYEYSWYGQFEIDDHRFLVIGKDFENFDRKLN